MIDAETALNPVAMLKPGRAIAGYSAILLPFTETGEVDWDGFGAHVARTAQAGLVPAVNMDTGYVNLLDDATRLLVLKRAADTLAGGPFVAGAFVTDRPGEPFDLDGYRRQIQLIQQHGGTPIVFQSYGLTGQNPSAIVESYAALGRDCPRFFAFELGQMFAPFGMIYDLETYTALLDVPQCIGAKHSSLSRMLEWQRLQLRDGKRPDFKVLTGNDLAIDMVMYGSDYLLGITTFAPDLFATRDLHWRNGDPAFYEVNDWLQYLGFFAFRAPVPAYKHSAAQFLKLRGWLRSDAPHPAAQRRPDSDLPILREIGQRLGVVEAA